MSIYHHLDSVHNLTSPRAVVPYLLKVFKPKSVLDVGCGIGTWLCVFDELGLADYLGIDGSHVDKTRLKIPIEKFEVQNLLHPQSLGRRFDLVLCLEVAEHLPPSAAENFVKFLTEQSDTIIFSAAIPGQDGQNHLNEQWPAYWEELFAKHGYFFHDVLRPQFWLNNEIQWWYRQNIFLINKQPSSQPVMPLVHPGLFKEVRETAEQFKTGQIGVANAWRMLGNALKSYIKR